MGGQTFHLMPLTEYVGRSHIFYHIWEDCSNWRGEQERAGALHTGGYVPDTTICCVENLFAASLMSSSALTPDSSPNLVQGWTSCEGRQG